MSKHTDPGFVAGEQPREHPLEPLESNPYRTEDAVSDAVVFDIGSEFGHFRKPHSTPTAETFGLIPRTTVAGLVAGMLGLPRDSYYGLFAPDTSRIAVSLEAAINRQSHGFNLLDTKGSKAQTKGAKTAKFVTKHRDPTAISVLSEPRFRIYVSVESAEFMADLDEVLRGADPSEEGTKPVYTPSMGKARHLAWIEYVGRFPIEDRVASGEVEIRSAVPGDPIPLVVEPGKRYVSEGMPAYMKMEDGYRTASGSRRMTYDRTGDPLILKGAGYASVGGDNVVFE